jgi:hypothetical protein
MLGASSESSKVFASCSERGANEAVKAEERKKDDDVKKAIAAEKAVILAAKNKLIGETIEKMKNL